MGPRLVVNYKTEDVVQKGLDFTDGIGLDRIVEVDLAANVGTDLAVLRPGADIVVYGSGAAEISVPFFPAIVKHARLRFFIVYNLSPEDRARAIADLTHLLATNSLQHNIAVRLPLARIAEAHELVERGLAVGNVVLEVASK